MGYSLTIGDKKPGRVKDGEDRVEPLSSTDCPDFVDSEQESQRLPSYSGWRDFCDEVGLTDLFYKKVLKSHPGVYKLTKKDLDHCLAAKVLFLKKHPNAKTITFDQFPASFKNLGLSEREEQLDSISKENWTLNRLEWLCFWIDYALKNCKNPTLWNS
jgi:hypothetical protein